MRPLEEHQGEFREIQMDTTQPRAMEPRVEAEAREDQAATPAEAEPDDEDEEYIPRSATPVWGGVMRFGGSSDDDDEKDEVPETDPDEEDPDEDPEEDPEEDSEEAHMEEEPAGYTDDMGTTADDIIESSTVRIAELEEQVQHLEEQNAVHQYVEDQYREVAY